ncbi:MAG: hypothetical protein JST89_13510 [Cyanobacteria bacterium SZAS-4]|nr:hypothetical protein [Cyanobacteria bacterium SZAS-4]
MPERLKVSEGEARMIPAGYMYKQIRARPDYIKAPHVIDIYSAGECGSDVTSPNFCDYTKHFRHNGFGFFNNPEIMREVANLVNIDLTPMSLFYYEIYELECDFVSADRLDVHWIPARCDVEFTVDVSPPQSKTLVGYDALLAANVSAPDCSLLSCSNLAENFEVNVHCLFDTFDMAKAAISTGVFHEKEQYPQRLVAVFTAG